MKVESKFGTYTMETRSSTQISTDKLGVFIERLKKIGIEVKLSGNFPWIYLDEIHTLVGSGNSSGSMDGSNIFKPALSRGEIQVINGHGHSN